MRQFNMFLLFVLLAGCSQEQRAAAEIVPLEVTYKDGIYKATYDAYDANNWKSFIEVQVRGGIVGSATFDDVNPSGEYKTQNQWYSETMKQQVGISPLEAANELVDRLVMRNGADVDALSGATLTSKKFFELATAALANAASGSPETAVLPLNDTYTVEGDRNGEGYLPRLVLTFENGKITQAVFDQIHLGGDSRRNDGDGMAADPAWRAAVESLEAQIQESQDPSALLAPEGQELVTELFRGLVQRILLQRSGS